MLALYAFVISEILLLFYIDLIPEQSYTIYISSENSITDQVPEEQFTTISSSVLVKTGNEILVKIHMLPVLYDYSKAKDFDYKSFLTCNIVQFVKETCTSLLAMFPVPPVQITLSKFCH